MPRLLHSHEPEVINSIENINNDASNGPIVFETGNEDKVKEIRRILKNFNIANKKLDIDEIQSLDPFQVVSKKAKEAWKQNNYNPIIVEDTSLEILALGNRPSTYVKDFLEDINIRRMICEEWLNGKDRRVVARVLLAVFDGKEVYIREGKVSGNISEKLLGTNGFGWDDIFIPDGQKLKNPLTFAEMSAEQKDKFSMRRKALEALSENLSRIIVPVFMLGEPYEQEIKRVSFDKLQNRKAIKFAYLLECLEKSNKPSKTFEATEYSSIKRTKNIYYTRFVNQEKSNSLGLILTDPDRNNINLYDNGEPVIWQMGPERRQVSLAQRADFFELNQNREIYGILDKIEKDIRNFPKRSCRRSRVIERFLGILNDGMVVNSVALKELGYKKISTGEIVSRTSIAKTGLFNVIGKYPRSIFGVGSMPPVSGWRDVITTAAIAHSLVFTTRNSIFAGNLDQQIALINDAKKSLRKIGLTSKELNLAERNIGAAIGSGDVTNEMRNVDKLYKNAGIRLFRIYGINSDKRVIEIAKSLRQKYQDEIEIFFGQVADKKQCLKMISDDIRVDGLIFGHGGGRTCTSAANGMAITTLEEIYDVASDRRFKDISILVEGGVGTSVGAIIVLGVDGILYNQQFTRCTIETGDIYFQHKSGRICQPYHGSASAPTMIIESNNPEIHDKRMSKSGRALNVEGIPGYNYYSEKANSMSFYMNEFRAYAARLLADVGCKSIAELRSFLNNSSKDLLRIVSSKAQETASPYVTKE